MCMMLNIPPAIEAGVVDYEKSSGRSVESLLIDCLQKEFAKQRKRDLLASQFDAFVDSLPKLEGEPYKFRRADAYDEELA